MVLAGPNFVRRDDDDDDNERDKVGRTFDLVGIDLKTEEKVLFLSFSRIASGF